MTYFFIFLVLLEVIWKPYLLTDLQSKSSGFLHHLQKRRNYETLVGTVFGYLILGTLQHLCCLMKNFRALHLVIKIHGIEI